jgi:hypothetical protein
MRLTICRDTEGISAVCVSSLRRFRGTRRMDERIGNLIGERSAAQSRDDVEHEIERCDGDFSTMSFDERIKVGETGSKFFLVYPESRRNQRKIRMFRDWLLAEAGHKQIHTSRTLSKPAPTV